MKTLLERLKIMQTRLEQLNQKCIYGAITDYECTLNLSLLRADVNDAIKQVEGLIADAKALGE